MHTMSCRYFVRAGFDSAATVHSRRILRRKCICVQLVSCWIVLPLSCTCSNSLSSRLALPGQWDGAGELQYRKLSKSNRINIVPDLPVVKVLPNID